MSTTTKNVGRVSIVPKGYWNINNTYIRLDLVTYDGNSYIAKKDVPKNIQLSNNEYWMLIALKGEQGASAYEQAVAGGYTGTEAQFVEDLASFKTLSEQAADSAEQAALIVDAVEQTMTATTVGPASIATFEASVDGMPLKGLTVDIKPMQAEGTPTPENPLPISGWTGANVFNDPKYALKINWNQIRTDSVQTYTADGITTAYDPQTHLFTITNNSRTTNYSQGSTQCIASSVDPIPGHRYALLGEYHAGVSVSAVNNTAIRVTTSVGRIMTMSTATTNTSFKLRITSNYDFVSAHPVGDVYSFYLNIVDITQLLGEEAAATATYDQIAEMFPNDWYPYNAGEITCVSAVNGDPYKKISVNWQNEAGTVYGGTLDVTTGVLEAKYVKFTLTPDLQYINNSDRTNAFSVYVLLPFKAKGQLNMYCNCLQVQESARDAVVPATQIANSLLAAIIAFPKTIVSSYDDIRTKITELYNSGTPIEIVYQIDQPIVYQLTLQKVITFLGTNNIWADIGDVTVTYGAYLETIKVYADQAVDSAAAAEAVLASIPDDYTELSDKVDNLNAIFIAEYGVTTYNEIDTHVKDGNLVVLKQDGLLDAGSFYTVLSGTSFGEVAGFPWKGYIFTRPAVAFGDTVNYTRITCGSDNEWTTEYSEARNINTDIVGTFYYANAYNIGDYVQQNSRIYRFIAPHTAGSYWNTSEVVEVVLTNEIDDLKNQINTKAPAIYSTASGTMARFNANAEGLPLKDLIVNIEPIQSGSGVPSPENIRQFTTLTECSIYHSDTDISNPNIISITFPSDATVYGGTLDVVNKKLIVSYAVRTLPNADSIRDTTFAGTGKFVRYSLPSNSSVNDYTINIFGEKIKGIMRSSSEYRSAWSAQTYTGGTNNYIGIYVPANYTLEQIDEAIAGSQIVYRLATPTVYDLSSVPNVTTLLGTNNIWSEYGDVTVKYPIDIQSYFDGATKTVPFAFAWELGTINTTTGDRDSDNSTNNTKITRIRSFSSFSPLSDIGYIDIKPGYKFALREYDRDGNYIAASLGWTNTSLYYNFNRSHVYRILAAYEDDRPILPEDAPLTVTFTVAYDGVIETDYYNRLERNPIIQSRYSDSDRKSLTLLHYSDIHASFYSMCDIQAFYDRNYNIIDDIINTGDLVNTGARVTANGNTVEPFSPNVSYNVGDFLTYGGYLYRVTQAFSGEMKLSGYCEYWGRLKHEYSVNAYYQMSLGQKSLFVIGNHDTNICNYTAADTPVNNHKAMGKAEALERYYTNIDNWGVVRPSTDVCYYYKDYSTQKIRLICLDVQFWDSTELSWLETTLAGAKTAGYGVIVAAHCVPGAITGYTDTNFTSYDYPNNNSGDYTTFGRYTNGAAVPAIESFIEDGGEFICWMCGHNHTNRIAKCTNSPNITVVQIENAGNFNSSLHENSRTGVGVYSRTCANAVSFNTSDKLIKIVRFGTNIDYHMRQADYLCFDYATRQLILNKISQDKFDEISEDVDALKSAINGDIVDIDPGTLVSGYMDTATGIKRSSSTGLGVTGYIDIGNYKKIAFRRIRSTSATAASGTCFYDSNQNWIGGIVSLRSQPAAGYDTQLTIADVPDGAYYVRFTGYMDTATYGDFIVKGIKSSIPNDINNVVRVPQIGNIFCVASTLPGADTFNDVIGLYDTLVENYPLVMSKNVLTSGSFNNYEYVFSTGNYNTKGSRTRDSIITKPKILVTSGTHGAERSAVMSLYYFVKAMCENAYTLNDVINSAEYHIIPIVCPWGYTNNSRVNENGVNINRNFATSDWTQTSTGDDYSGASAGDQVETQVVQNWLTTNNDAEIYIDFHNSGYSEEISALLGLSTQAHMMAKMCYLQSVNEIIPYLKNARNLGQYNVFAYTGNTDIPGTSKGYGEEHGIMSFTLETSNNVENHGKYGAFVNAIGCEMFGATIKGMVKYVLLKDPANVAILG